MRRLLIIISLLFISIMSYSQIIYTDILRVYDKFELGKYEIVGISNDTTLAGASPDSLVTQFALKRHLDELPFEGTTNTVYLISSIADTSTISTPINGDIAFVDSTLVAFRSAAKWNVFAGGGASGPGSWYDLTDVPAGIYADTIATNEWQNASQVSIDSGGDYIATNVEGAIAEIADSLTQHRIDIDASGDDLGNHTATQDIDAAGHDINNGGTVNTDVLSTGYTKQNNLYATGIRTNIYNIYVGDTIYLGMLTKVGFTGSQALKIDVRGYNGYSSWMLKSYSSSYTDLILEHYYSSNSAYDFSEIIPVIWTDGNNVHIAITNTGTIPSYTTSCSISDYGGYESTWTKAVSTDLPVGFTANALTRKQYSLDDVRANNLSSRTYYEDDTYAVGMHSSRITINAGDTLYIGSLEKSIIDASSSSIEIDITGYLSYSKWVLSGYGAYSRIMLAYSNQNSGNYDPASVKPVIWVDGNTYHIAIANTSSAPSYATNVRLNELAATKKSTWTKAVSTDLPVGFTANVLTEKPTTFNSLKSNGNISVAGDAAFGNYIFNTDQPISTGFAGNKPFGLNVATEELEVLNNISSFYVDVEDISARFSSSLLDNVLYELLNKIEELEATSWEADGGELSTSYSIVNIDNLSVNDIEVNDNGNIQLKESSANGASYIQLQAPASLTTSSVKTLPAAGSGYWKEDGLGNITIKSKASAGGVMGGSYSGTTVTQIDILQDIDSPYFSSSTSTDDWTYDNTYTAKFKIEYHATVTTDTDNNVEVYIYVNDAATTYYTNFIRAESSGAKNISTSAIVDLDEDDTVQLMIRSTDSATASNSIAGNFSIIQID